MEIDEYAGMKHQSPDHWKTVQDADLVEWLARDSDDPRELIVEAKLPARKVTVQKGIDGRMFPNGINGLAASDRTPVLAELYAYLADKVDIPPVLLKAAGAIAVKATSQQVRQFAEHPLIKAIRPNRRLGHT
jgi:hypothetical protein